MAVFFLKQKIFHLKKITSPGQIQTPYLCRPWLCSYLQAKMDGNAKKFELIMNQDTSDSVKQVVKPKKKGLYSSLITHAYRKRKN